MTLAEYARRRGCAPKSVSLAVSTGRLAKSVLRDEAGIPVRDELGRLSIIDAELADREWAANTRQRVDRPVAPEPLQPAPTSPAPRATDYNASRSRRAEASARREAAMAELAEIDLAERRRELVSASQARADVEQAYSLVKTRLLAVPSLLAQRMPDLAARVVPVCDELVRQALQELSER